MADRKWYSTGEAANALGVSRDSLISALRSGAPEPQAPRVGGRRVFGEEDLAQLRAWFNARWHRSGRRAEA